MKKYYKGELFFGEMWIPVYWTHSDDNRMVAYMQLTGNFYMFDCDEIKPENLRLVKGKVPDTVKMALHWLKEHRRMLLLDNDGALKTTTLFRRYHCIEIDRRRLMLELSIDDDEDTYVMFRNL